MFVHAVAAAAAVGVIYAAIYSFAGKGYFIQPVFEEKS